MVFSALFLAEAIVKIVALGLYGRNAYLSDGWNWLDLLIVILGVIDFFPGDSSNLSGLRALRVMRPLRAITRFPPLRFLVHLLLQCLPMLSNVVGLLCFLFVVTG